MTDFHTVNFPYLSRIFRNRWHMVFVLHSWYRMLGFVRNMNTNVQRIYSGFKIISVKDIIHRIFTFRKFCGRHTYLVIKCGILLLLCVYLKYQIAQPSFFGWELHLVVFGLFILYVVFSLSFVIIFVIVLAVSPSSVCSLENMSVFFTFVELVVCVLLHSSSICSCVWFATFTADYVVVFAPAIVFFYIQHSRSCFKHRRSVHSA